MVPPTPQQISLSSTDESQWQGGAGRRQWEKGVDFKVEIKAWELLMDPEDSEVCLRYIMAHAKRRESRMSDIFSTKEETDHLLASRNRWLEHEGRREARSCKKGSKAVCKA